MSPFSAMQELTVFFLGSGYTADQMDHLQSVKQMSGMKPESHLQSFQGWLAATLQARQAGLDAGESDANPTSEPDRRWQEGDVLPTVKSEASRASLPLVSETQAGGDHSLNLAEVVTGQPQESGRLGTPAAHGAQDNALPADPTASLGQNVPYVAAEADAHAGVVANRTLGNYRGLPLLQLHPSTWGTASQSPATATFSVVQVANNGQKAAPGSDLTVGRETSGVPGILPHDHSSITGDMTRSTDTLGPTQAPNRLLSSQTILGQEQQITGHGVGSRSRLSGTVVPALQAGDSPLKLTATATEPLPGLGIVTYSSALQRNALTGISLSTGADCDPSAPQGPTPKAPQVLDVAVAATALETATGSASPVNANQEQSSLASSWPTSGSRILPDLIPYPTGSPQVVASTGGQGPSSPAAAGAPGSIRAQVTEQLLPLIDGTVGSQRISLQLDPPHLGRLEVQIQQDGNRLTVIFQATSPETEAALREGAKELAEALVTRHGTWNEVQVRTEKDTAEGRHDKQPNQEDQPRREQSDRREHRRNRS